ncbi:MAG: hypothetical protein IZT59_04445 [Verrucomicrobia bacterium]|nr:hypothetical protein [Verrucomicrobiota bacterium]
MARLDPSISFTPAVEKELGKENVIVIKDAVGGQPVRRWYKDWKPAKIDKPEAIGDIYDKLMKKVLPAIKGKETSTVTFLWMQGERDAKEGYKTLGQRLAEKAITLVQRKYTGAHCDL